MTELQRRQNVSERLLGGSFLGVVIRLAIMSFVVGLVMRMLGISPADVVAWFERAVASISAMSLNTLGEFGSIFLLGAAVVIPIWAVMRVLKLLSR